MRTKKLLFTREQLENLYITQNKSMSDIAKMYGVNHTAILYWIKKFHIVTRKGGEAVVGRILKHHVERKYQVNKDFFSINSPEMYWVLGFIAADGCIERDRTWSVCQRDIEPLEKIADLIETNHPIEKRAIYRLRINCIKHVKDMEMFGITKRKSATLEMPNISDEYFWHFIRGYFDGDGSIYRFRRKVKDRIYYPVNLKFVGSPSFIRSLNDEFKNRLNIPNRNSYKVGKNKLVEDITYRGRKQVFEILWHMYKESNSSIRLDRKYMRYKEWFIKEFSFRAQAVS